MRTFDFFFFFIFFLQIAGFTSISLIGELNQYSELIVFVIQALAFRESPIDFIGEFLTYFTLIHSSISI